MKIKLDENIPASLAIPLRKLNHDVETVVAEGLGGKVDEVIWENVLKESRFLVTQDLDFSGIRVYKPGTHHGILIIRLSNPSRSLLVERISNIFKFEYVENWKGCLVIATNRKIRIKRT